MSKRKPSRRKNNNSERGDVSLSSPIEPRTLHMTFVVVLVTLGGIVALAVAFAGTRH